MIIYRDGDEEKAPETEEAKAILDGDEEEKKDDSASEGSEE